MKTTLSFEELKKYLQSPALAFPKYATQLLNLANQNAQATRPRVVGQLSELIQEFPHQSLREWEEWYVKKYPEAIKIATEKIFVMVAKLKEALNEINQQIIEQWVHDLIIVKTYIGFCFQEAILAKGANLLGVDYKVATPNQESKGIDGFLGRLPVSIKPTSYKTKASLHENIEATLIYYEKTKNGIDVDYSLVVKKLGK